MDTQDLWRAALSEIELNLSRASFNTWFKNSSILKQERDRVVIGCSNNFTKEWLENRYHKIIIKALRNINAEIKTVEYVIHPETSKHTSKRQTTSTRETIQDDKPQLGLIDFTIDKETNLNSRYTLETFVVGGYNELAYAASLSVVEKPGTQYNPLFIYGGVGLGKTHLLQAIGNAFKEKFKNRKKIRYITSQKFTDDIVSAIRRQTIDEIKQEFKEMDVLLIDDIQFIAGKEKTQEELFFIFNALYEKNKQIVFTSDRPPKAISSIEERLRSRFEGGMIADIGFPDLETRMAILKAKTQHLKTTIDEKILELIATRIQKNIRELEGALNRVLAYTKLKQTIPSIKEIEHLLGEISQPYNKNITPKQIIKAVAEFYDVSESDIFKRSRSKELVKPRQIIMYFLRDILKMSYPSIGEKMGGKDHTTVIHACNKIEKEMIYNTQLSQEIALIKERLFETEKPN